MNHTTLGRIVAVSMVAVLTIAGISVLTSAKVMAAFTLKVDGTTITASEKGIEQQGPGDFSFKGDLPPALVPQLFSQLPSSDQSQLPSSDQPSAK
jgi:hypothetical protein